MWRLSAALILVVTLHLGAQTTVVLPFFNLTGKDSLDWIGEGVAETIRGAAAEEGVPILDRQSRQEAYRRLSLRPHAVLTRGSMVKVAELLEARKVVFGSFQIGETTGSGPTIHLTAGVLDLDTLSLVPEESSTALLEDLAEAQARLAWKVVRILAPRGGAPAEDEFLRRHGRVRLDALESHIRGLMATSAEQKHRFFTQAARLDEKFVQPCFELGKLLLDAKDYKVAAGWFERVPPDSPDFLEAQFYLGLCRFQLAQYDLAIASFRAVADSAPVAEVWNNLGAAQSRKGLPEALESFRKAGESDPQDADYRFNQGYALWKAGEFDPAAEMFRASLNLAPADSEAILMLGRCLKRTAVRDTEQRVTGLERIKPSLKEAAYLNLRAARGRRAR
ncbi:MAG: tetratricopeptide repeat protein [Bryobacterales bacterium]|nr:tetratricopeptide repeat protein [Bryobacterales bacterium]